MDCIESPESSSIVRFCYDGRKEILRVEFQNGGVYNYYDVPDSVFKQMSQASSKGKFFMDNVREEYDYMRV
ncbi:MAG: KTSC domain-containing protein [Blastocatellia bacterium AA13]|nr:MAG: KTSC domain-containing protein [Blastocatellia bacterium AA13]